MFSYTCKNLIGIKQDGLVFDLWLSNLNVLLCIRVLLFNCLQGADSFVFMCLENDFFIVNTYCPVTFLMQHIRTKLGLADSGMNTSLPDIS